MSKLNVNILPINGTIFPYQPVKLFIPSTSAFYSKNLIGTFLGVCFQKDKDNKQSSPNNNMTDIGIVLKVTHEVIASANSTESSKMIGGLGIQRFKIKKFTHTAAPMAADIELIKEEIPNEKEMALNSSGIISKIRDLAIKYADYVSDTDSRAKSRIDFLKSESNYLKLFYTVCSYLKIDEKEKYKFLEQEDIEEKMKKLQAVLEEQLKSQEVKSDIAKKARSTRDEEMKKFVLRSQLQEINKQLYGTEKDDASKLEQRIKDLKASDEVKEKLMEEFRRFTQLTPRDPEHNMQRKYLETVLDLPWNTSSDEIKDILHAEKVLDKDHAGLEKIKKRILEFLAVKILKKDSKGSILCFQGPPGVGKTSLGKSIAESLGRKFHRISLGGVHDEAEIRGHRKTYIGSMPGVFVDALLKCKTNNPVILLDEIDKIGRHSAHGDPSSALLEVLDPNQNHTFKDHYISLPFDLSNVLFIATANTLETIQPALLDRMEIVNLSGYTVTEKVEIARNYLIPKQILESGLEPTQIEFNDESIRLIAEYYTAEAGVRNLERKVGAICRKVAFDYLKSIQIGEKEAKEVKEAKEGKEGKSKHKAKSQKFKPVKVNEVVIEEVLGPRIIKDDVKNRVDQPGISIGMAWTQVGGKVLLVEASKSAGKGVIQITGQLGDVMKESVQTALGWIKAHPELLTLLSMTPDNRRNVQIIDIKPDFQLDKYDLNIHFPAAAIPKDGPSAGITITIALISLLTGIKVRNDIAMTGEISLKGAVLPVGGIKEKCIGAYTAGIHKVILPENNRKDIEEISKEIKSKMTFYFVKRISDVIQLALETSISTAEVETVVNASISGINKQSKL